MKLQCKRVYEEASAGDGYRVLVDRLWPRGVSKERAALDVWLKDIAPSVELRTWFGHLPERFEEFTVRYQDELSHNSATIQLQEIMSDHPVVTLLYGAKDPRVNHAVVLRDFIERREK
jgi:uncharacterized protein YeaO (DUF488 family)